MSDLTFLFSEIERRSIGVVQVNMQDIQDSMISQKLSTLSQTLLDFKTDINKRYEDLEKKVYFLEIDPIFFSWVVTVSLNQRKPLRSL